MLERLRPRRGGRGSPEKLIDGRSCLLDGFLGAFELRTSKSLSLESDLQAESVELRQRSPEGLCWANLLPVGSSSRLVERKLVFRLIKAPV